MPKQSVLHIIKRWRQYEPREKRSGVLKNTRGVYVLYRHGSADSYKVVYIGVAGLGESGFGETGRSVA